MNDDKFMGRVVKLALRGTGFVSPNPRVGALIVKDGQVIAEGWHNQYGGNHAEIDAINNSGLESFEGCTLYVNLEPCTHQGKTPPCTPAVIDRKFSRVVIGMKDPNPLVAGNGIRALREAGIDVGVGILEDECRWLNRYFIKFISTGVPYITAKMALTLDGMMATNRNESKWISSGESRKRAHVLRASHDVIMIGKNTAAVDNPKLNVRNIKGRDPIRVVLDSKLSLPLSLDIFSDDEKANTIVFTSESATQTRKADNLRMAGVNVIPALSANDGTIDIPDVMGKLARDHNCSSILVEGGSGLFSNLMRDELIDEMQLFVAPKIIGKGINPFRDFDAGYLKNAKNFEIKGFSKSGDDMHIIAIKK
jgi:diaminohydroxyphosphoribosylaminopyrimidine deaminase/5-amino-6-(5-phosphoribosylamino)uracil reductase